MGRCKYMTLAGISLFGDEVLVRFMSIKGLCEWSLERSNWVTKGTDPLGHQSCK